MQKTAIPISQIQNNGVIKFLGKLQLQEIKAVHLWLESIKEFMITSKSGAAKERLELALGYSVELLSYDSDREPEIKVISKDFANKYYKPEIIEKLAKEWCPDWDQILILCYPPGRKINIHRDSSAYLRGVVQINIKSNATFLISDQQSIESINSYFLEEGDCFWFDNKQYHGIESVEQERYCICFFKLKFVDEEKSKKSLPLLGILDSKKVVENKIFNSQYIPVTYDCSSFCPYYCGEGLGEHPLLGKKVKHVNPEIAIGKMEGRVAWVDKSGTFCMVYYGRDYRFGDPISLPINLVNIIDD